MQTEGTRKDYADNTTPKPWEYGKDAAGQWYAAALVMDGVLIADLSPYRVFEYPDGTITVKETFTATSEDGSVS